MKRIPLSSVASVPLSDPTRTELLALGLSEEDLFRKSELWGRSVVCLKNPAGDLINPPSCYRLKFDPQSDLCSGCAWMPSCWMSCKPYLDRIDELGYPPGVPRHVVDARLKNGKIPPPKRKKLPSKRTKKLPPKRRE